jgi:dolichol kinase
MHKTEEIPYSQEILRKLIHISSLAIPIIYCFVTREIGLMILIPMTLFSILLDILMHRSLTVQKVMLPVFGKLMRPHELRQDKIMLNGASYVLMSAVLCVFIFPKVIAITAFSILIVSDTAAALIGRKIGKNPFLDKSREGTLAFIVSAIAVVAVITLLNNAPLSLFIAGCIGSIAGGVVEAGSTRLKMDDNFSIPITVGGLMWIVGILLTPSFLWIL